jgi:hypothetical protein
MATSPTPPVTAGAALPAKATVLPVVPGSDLIARTTTGSASPLPISYGTNKIPAQLINSQKFDPWSGGGAHYTAWQPSHAYAHQGERATNGGQLYRVVVPGTSAGSGGPSGTTTSIDGSVTWNWISATPTQVYWLWAIVALCEGEVDFLLRAWWNKDAYQDATGQPLAGLGFTFCKGPDAGGQVEPIGTLPYQHTAILANTSDYSAPSDTQGTPAIALELQGLRFGATTPDVNPEDIIRDLWSHARRGCALPAMASESDPGGYRVYCDAMGFRISLLMNSQRSALEWIKSILDATNSDATWSSGALKILPLGDRAAPTPVYGSTGYIPAGVAAYSLGVDDFLDPDQPVQVERRSDVDCFNSWPVEYCDRSLGYVRATAEVPDAVDMARRGRALRAPTSSLPVTFADQTAPTVLAQILTQRSLWVRNTYTFRVSWRYILLEPGDLLELTEPGIGLAATPVRITRVDEGEDGTITITAEDYPVGVSSVAS